MPLSTRLNSIAVLQSDDRSSSTFLAFAAPFLSSFNASILPDNNVSVIGMATVVRSEPEQARRKRMKSASASCRAWPGGMQQIVATIETHDGQKLTPLLTVTNGGKNLAAKYESKGTVIDAKEVKIKDNHLLFQIDTDLEGAPLHVEFKGRPYGTKLAGTLEYSVNGDTGELDFAGLCKAESKP